MLKVAILGLGWWGKHIINTLEDSPLLKVIAASSKSVEKHKSFVRENNLRFYESYPEMLKDPDIEGVIICTPNSQHEEQVLKALSANKQVFCEKPLALKKKAAENMILAAKKANIILGIGHERRYDPAMEKLLHTIHERNFGQKMHIEANWSHDILAALDGNNWRGSFEEAPAGGMTGTGVHMTDLFISMFGKIDSLIAITANRVLDFETGDISAVLFKFKNGATGQLSVISKTPYYCRISAFGDNMWAEVRDLKHPMHKGENELTTCIIGEDPIKTQYPPVDTIKKNMEEWAMATIKKTNYKFTDFEKIHNVAVLESINKSVIKKEWVKL